MFFLAEFQEAGVFKDMIRTLLASICDIIYRLIIVFYQLFMAIGDATILSSADIQKIFNRIGLILGIIMMFRLIFSFVQYMLDPDKITDKETGVAGLIRKVIIVILALGLVNWVFEKAFELQSSILEENVIGKVILGVGSSKDIDMKEFGTMFSYTLYSNFYYQNPEMDTGAQEGADTIGCGSDYFDTELKNYVATYNDFEAVHKCINEEGRSNGNLFGHKIYYTTYHGLEALVVGGFVLWVLIMYTITLGVRVIKLAFLRVIAPIPILSYLSPKKSTTFSNWLRQCIMTYLDLFIRIAIIYFAMLLIDIIFSRGAILGATTSFAVDGSDKMLFIGLDKWFNIILVLGILLFAKKMPEIIGDLFPGFNGKGGLDFGIGLKSRTDYAGKGFVKRAAGAAIGAGAIGLTGAGQGFFRMNKDGEQVHGFKRGLNTLTGFASGFGRGTVTGATNGGNIRAGLKKGFRAQVAASEATNKTIAAGTEDFVGRFAAGVAKDLGLPSAYDRELAKINKMKRQKERNDKVGGAAGSMFKGFDDIGDAIKGEIEGDKSKLELTDKGSKASMAALQKLVKDGTVVKVGDDYRMVIGEENYTKSDGTIGRRKKIGDSVLGKKISDVDNMLEGKIAIAENNLNTANTNLMNARNEKDKIDSQIKSLEPGSAEYDSLKAKLDAADRDVKSFEKQVADAEVERNSINKTKFVKSLKQAAIAELMMGNYESTDISQDLVSNLSQVTRSIEANSSRASDMIASGDPVDVELGYQYASASQTMQVLLDYVKNIQTDAAYKTTIDGKEQYDIEKITDAIKVLKDPELIDLTTGTPKEIEAKKVLKEKIKAYVCNAVDFDNVTVDDAGNPKYGTYNMFDDVDEVNIGTEMEPKMLTVTLYDLMDKLADFNKKLQRNMTNNSNELQNQIDVAEQSARVMAARNAEENRFKFFGGS